MRLIADLDREAVAEHVINELGETVAAVNPGYPPQDRVADAVYLADARDSVEPHDDSGAVAEAAAWGVVRLYSFLASQLAAVDDDAGVMEAST